MRTLQYRIGHDVSAPGGESFSGTQRLFETIGQPVVGTMNNGVGAERGLHPARKRGGGDD